MAPCPACTGYSNHPELPGHRVKSASLPIGHESPAHASLLGAFPAQTVTVVGVMSAPPPATPPHTAEPPTVIVGGGLAGLSAAVGLATQGRPALLFESRLRLGGRAGSFHDGVTEEWIDHCQHVGMGCCTSLLWLIETVGLEECFRRDRSLHFVAPPDSASPRPPPIHRLQAAHLPAPLHLLPGLSQLKYLNGRQRREIRRGMLALARSSGPDLDRSFADWLAEHGQSPGSVAGFWEVILVSALSESLDHIAVSHARHVFVSGFLGHRSGWELIVPRVPLEEIYGKRLSGWLADHGVEVRTGSGVRGVEWENERVVGVRLGDESIVATDRVVLAVPHHRLADLLPEPLDTHPQVTALEQLDTAPIAAVHLWFDRPVTDLPHAVLVGRLGQWMFRRESSSGNGDYLQVVISAAHHVTGRDREQVISEVLDELRAIWPESAGARLHRSRLVIEHRAVVSPRPGTDSLRPKQLSPWTGLYLAGDWTHTGWPSTMEGAVRSGLSAAEAVLADLFVPAQLHPPDLVPGRLAKWLLGIGRKTT